jgi:aminopeptidase N
MKINLPLVLILTLFISCNFFQKLQKEPAIVDIGFDERDLDTLFVEAPPKFTNSSFSFDQYNPSSKRQNDLLHTKLDIRFDWTKQHVLGKATLTLKPYFYTTNKLILDAKGFDVHRVAIIQGKDTASLIYQYNNEQLLIELNDFYTKEQTYTIFIDYTSKPNERESKGSEAITDDKGLYFINPLGDEKGKPQQIWTQGETEANSAWFPTIDKPNERCTQEIYITVKDNFKTLSNGTLQSSIQNKNGTRTDYWKIDKPHAPYLFMLAVGEFSVVTETWRGKEISYWVEPEYEAHAKAIFANTIEMMDFFSERLGTPYEWSKYAQIVVRDFVSGAMENTTGVVFGDFVQKTDRELIDNHNDKIVAHELIHHWFGDLVTCESWANLPLNEGFANYGEYLWLEYKYGRDEADLHLFDELQGYLFTSDDALHELIDYDYTNREDMFDAHSYNKGGAILHMLRNYVGDEAFFRSLQLYLERFKFKSAEAHDLRLVFEEVTGEDLNWFFNQWFFAKGHPKLEVTYSYDTLTGQAVVEVEQIQSPNFHQAIYQLPLKIDIYTGNEVISKNILINQRQQRFHFKLNAPPVLMNLDADRILVGTITENKTMEQYIYQFRNAPRFFDRHSALSALSTHQTNEANALREEALKDDFWLIVYQAINSSTVNKNNIGLFRELLHHPHSQVRVGSVNKLKSAKDETLVSTLLEMFEKGDEKAYTVISARLNALQELDQQAALTVAKKLQDETFASIITTVAEIFANTKDTKHLNFFYKNAVDMDEFYASKFYSLYTELLLKADKLTIEKHTMLIATIAQEDSFNWKRYHAAKIIKTLSDAFRKDKKEDALVQQLDRYIAIIKAEEKSSRIQNLYRGW